MAAVRRRSPSASSSCCCSGRSTSRSASSAASPASSCRRAPDRRRLRAARVAGDRVRVSRARRDRAARGLVRRRIRRAVVHRHARGSCSAGRDPEAERRDRRDRDPGRRRSSTSRTTSCRAGGLDLRRGRWCALYAFVQLAAAIGRRRARAPRQADRRSSRSRSSRSRAVRRSSSSGTLNQARGVPRGRSDLAAPVF